MASYYFLMASLPMLRAEAKPPLSYAEFLERCKSCVGAGRYALLESLTPASDKGPLLGEWSKFYAALQGELTDLRCERLGRQPQRRGGGDGALRREISAAVEGKDPLEAEKALLALQFKKLDELIGTHAFDDCALVGYALKLKLLERKNRFDQKKGRTEMDRILDGLQKQILVGERE